MKFMIFAHKRYAAIRYMCVVHVTWNNSRDIIEKKLILPDHRKQTHIHVSKVYEIRYTVSHVSDCACTEPLSLWQSLQNQITQNANNNWAISRSKSVTCIYTLFPYTKRKYNNRKQTFSKSHTFERITARFLLTYLVYGGIFDSRSFCGNKISKL